MCDYELDRDLTKIEAYLSERPIYADLKRRAYADVAIDELMEDIYEETSKAPYYVSGEERVSIPEIVDAFIEKMRYFRDLANPGKKLLLNVDVHEAESLSTIFM